jgi:hypothetical protein
MPNHLFAIRGDIAGRDQLEAFGAGEIHRLAEQVSSGVSARASLEKSGAEYSVFAEVHLLGGSALFGYASASSPEEAIRMAISKLEGRIGKWKGLKFR